jgi:hypothetical protein
MRTSALKYLTPGVFETSIQAVVAFRLAGADCQVTTTTMKVRDPVTQEYITWTLKDYTVYQLVQAIQAATGYSATDLNTAYAWCSASALMTGTSSTVWMSTETLPALSHALEEQTALADAELIDMLEQVIITTSQEHWADFWGSYFGVLRWENEADGTYTQRIIAEIFRHRVNKKAIEQIVTLITNTPTVVYEPHVDLCVLDSPSALLSAGPGAVNRAVLPDGAYWGFCSFDVQNEHYTSPMRTAVDRSRASGCFAFYQQAHNQYQDATEDNEGYYAQIGTITPSDRVYIFYLDDGNTVPPSGYTVIEEPKSRLFLQYLTTVDILINIVYDIQGKAWNPSISGISFNFDVWALLSEKDNLDPTDVENPLYCGGEWAIYDLINLGYDCSDSTIWERPIVSFPDRMIDMVYAFSRYAGMPLIWDDSITWLYWDEDNTIKVEWVESIPQLFWDDSVSPLYWDEENTIQIEWELQPNLVFFDTGVSMFWDDESTLLTVEDGNV